MKKWFAWLLVLCLTFSLIPTAFAADTAAEDAAARLYQLGLFKGTGTNKDGTPIFDLDKTPTRNQALIMLVRLLGKEEEALEGNWDIPFTDVTANMKPYVGYAYTHGLTNGTTATTYSGTNQTKPNQYITFVLRALGYESGKDFQVATAWELSDEIGLTTGQYNASTAKFTRGDVAKISAAALSVTLNEQKETLQEHLVANGVLRAWYEVDAQGRMYLKTNLRPNPKTGYSMLLKRYQRSGAYDHDSQGGSRFGTVQYDCTSAFGFVSDGGDIIRTEVYVFDEMDIAHGAFWDAWREIRTTEGALAVVADHLVAQFVLDDTIVRNYALNQYEITDFAISYNQARNKETYTAKLSVPIVQQGEYGLQYRSASGGQNAAFSYIDRAGDGLSFTREIDHFADSGSGTFSIVHCTYSQTGVGKFLLDVNVSSETPYSFAAH